MSKSLVVYHSADFDGKFSGAVAYHFLGDTADYVGWDFGDEPILVAQEYTKVYVIDLPPECLAAYTVRPGYTHCPTIWIDHHKSSIEKWADFKFPGFQLDGVAACRLAWAWFNAENADPVHGALPTLAEFKNRQVSEPFALTLAGEYDVWDKTDPRADSFQFGLYCRKWSIHELQKEFLYREGFSGPQIQSCIDQGQAVQGWQKQFAADVCKYRGYKVNLGGNTYWCLSSVHARNSMWFPNEAVPDDIDGLMCYRIEGDGLVKVSLYHREGREDIDHSPIAVSYGGGGHRGACGFQVTLQQAIEGRIIR